MKDIVKVRPRNDEATQDEHIVEVFMARFIPYWPLFAGVILVSLAAAFFYIKYVPPVYEAKASIIVNDEKKGTEESKLTESLVTVQSKQLVENEIEMLKSHKLMDSVVNRLNLYANISNKSDRHKLPAFNSCPVWLTVKDPKEISPVRNVSFSYDKAAQTVSVQGLPKPIPLNICLKI